MHVHHALRHARGAGGIEPIGDLVGARARRRGALVLCGKQCVEARTRGRLGADRNERGNPGPYGSDPFGLYGGLDTVSRGTNRPRGVSASAVVGDAGAMRHSAFVGWSTAPSFFTSPFGDSEDRVRRTTARRARCW